MVMLDGEGKAVAAVAETAGKVVDAASGLGRFLAKMLGTVPEDAVGLLGGDWISHLRSRNAHRLQLRTDEILGLRNAEIEPLSLSVARPLLEAAQDESRDELVEMWARLLANALDKSRPPIRRTFIEALERFDPLDALIMDRTFERERFNYVPHDEWPDQLGVTTDELRISLEHLREIGCIVLEERTVVPGHREESCHMLMPFGRELMRACSE